jgi:hypothetical protein
MRKIFIEAEDICLFIPNDEYARDGETIIQSRVKVVSLSGYAGTGKDSALFGEDKYHGYTGICGALKVSLEQFRRVAIGDAPKKELMAMWKARQNGQDPTLYAELEASEKANLKNHGKTIDEIFAEAVRLVDWMEKEPKGRMERVPINLLDPWLETESGRVIKEKLRPIISHHVNRRTKKDPDYFAKRTAREMATLLKSGEDIQMFAMPGARFKGDYDFCKKIGGHHIHIDLKKGEEAYVIGNAHIQWGKFNKMVLPETPQSHIENAVVLSGLKSMLPRVLTRQHNHGICPHTPNLEVREILMFKKYHGGSVSDQVRRLNLLSSERTIDSIS